MAYSVFDAGRHVKPREKRRKGNRLDIVRQFFRILKKLRFGCTIEEIVRDESMSRRTVYRWIAMVDELFGLERIVSPVGRGWMYRVNRDKIRERF
jgi:hypothetical protein